MCNMDNVRLNKRVFICCGNHSQNRTHQKNWNFKVKSKLKELGLDFYCNFNNILSKSQIKEVEENVLNILKEK